METTKMKVTINGKEYTFSDPKSLDTFVGYRDDEPDIDIDPEPEYPSELELLVMEQAEEPQGTLEMGHIYSNYDTVRNSFQYRELMSQPPHGPYHLFFHQKKSLAQTCAKMMDLYSEQPENLGYYLGYMWGALVAQTSELVEYLIEDYINMGFDDRMEYFRALNGGQQKRLNKKLTAWRDNMDQKKAEKKILQWCNEAEQQYGCSSKRAADIVGLAIQYRQLQSLEWLEIKPED